MQYALVTMVVAAELERSWNKASTLMLNKGMGSVPYSDSDSARLVTNVFDQRSFRHSRGSGGYGLERLRLWTSSPLREMGK